MPTKFIILGCGSSFGVPRPDGFFGNCDQKVKKNIRTRCSALIKASNKNILIDTSPDLRFQLISNKIKNIDTVFYSHLHADQTHGINDLRVFYLKNNKKIPVFADKSTKKYLKSTFGYCFKKNINYPPTLDLRNMKSRHFFNYFNNKVSIRTVKVKHGKIKTVSFIINKKCAYVNDVNLIYPKDIKYFKNLKFFIIDCLRYEEHPCHYNLEQVLNLIKIITPKKTILTNLSADLDYKSLIKQLPKNVVPAYDGMTLLL